ncbi:MAG: hypothetical protein JWQ97_863 [Phenylobacterium sp.]|nr:hypothetical protein [Phenylobacterium sp.]
MTAQPGFRCIAVVDLVNEDALETNQQRWREDDPFLALREDGARRYVRAMSQRSDQALFRPRSRIGVAQLWADDEATALKLYARLRDRGLTKAHPGLRDARLTVIANREHHFIGDYAERPGEGLKALYLNKRKPDMPVADYQAHWLNVHAPLVEGVPGLARYLQLHRLPATYDGDATELDGGAEMSWPDAAAYAAYGAAEDYQQRFRDDLPNLWDLRAGLRFFVKEEEVFDER